MCGLENVLYDATSWQRRLQAVLSHIGWSVSVDAISRAWQGFPEVEDRSPGLHVQSSRSADDVVEHSESLVRSTACLRSLGLPSTVADELARSSILFASRHDDGTRPFPASRDVLGRLARDGVRLAVVGRSPSILHQPRPVEATRQTDDSTERGPGDPAQRIRAILRRLGLDARFGVVTTTPVSQADLVEALGRIADEWKSSARSLAFVGHATWELEAAELAGWTSIAIHPLQRSPSDGDEVHVDCVLGEETHGQLRVADWIEFESVVRAA